MFDGGRGWWARRADGWVVADVEILVLIAYISLTHTFLQHLR